MIKEGSSASKAGSSAKAFLEAATTSNEAKGAASFAAGLLASLAGMSLLLRRRQSATVSASPELALIGVQNFGRVNIAIASSTAALTCGVVLLNLVSPECALTPFLGAGR